VFSSKLSGSSNVLGSNSWRFVTTNCCFLFVCLSFFVVKRAQERERERETYVLTLKKGLDRIGAISRYNGGGRCATKGYPENSLLMCVCVCVCLCACVRKGSRLRESIFEFRERVSFSVIVST